MKVSTTPIKGLLVVEPRVFHDERGWFMESFNEARFNQALIEHGQEPVRFVQDNHSLSNTGVLRGLHYQSLPHAQGKLVRVLSGAIWDVAVDVRLGSETYGKWYSLEISAKNFLQLWIPSGFAHGFLTLENHSQIQYKTTDYYHPDCEGSILWSDPNLQIDWPLHRVAGVPIVSKKDADASCVTHASHETQPDV